MLNQIDFAPAGSACQSGLFATGILRNEDGIPEDEENFQEAIAAVNTALHETKVTSSLQVLLAHSLACEITGKVPFSLYLSLVFYCEATVASQDDYYIYII